MIKTFQQLTNFMQSRNYGIKLGLERIHFLLEKLAHPEQHITAIHVAGTNGKGSTIRFLETALMNEGYKVGVFTSPSFTGICGHYFINQKEIEETELIQYINQLLPAIAELDQQNNHPTSFEIITVIAFLYFRNNVDIALIETGMGGRYDTTNCFSPIMAIITSIAKDHTPFLGNRIQDIAFHKAGIIKADCPVITGNIPKEAMEVIETEVKEKGATLYKLHHDFSYESRRPDQFSWRLGNEYTKSISLGLKGSHQMDNAAVALMAIHLLRQRGFTLTEQKMREAFERTGLPGRFELVHDKPVIVLDSAHNIAGIQAFLHTVEQLYRGENKQILFASFKDKDVQEILHQVEGHFNKVILTTFEHERAAPLAMLKTSAISRNWKINGDWRGEIDAMLTAKNKNLHYFITGSLHFITLVREYIDSKKGINM